jgi:hypothetical protein
MASHYPVTSLSRFALPLIFGGVVLTRLPFLWSGYGFDPDSWRLANVARQFWKTGVYEVSRFPGYPLHEMISAPFVALGGSFLSNAATLAATLALLWVWWRFIESRTSHPLMLLACLAFLPLLWVNSATTMDYVWSLLFLLLSVQGAANKRAVLAGIWLGVAAGFRPSNAACIIPLVALLTTREKQLRATVECCAAALVVVAAAFIVPIATYGVSSWLDGIAAQSDILYSSFSQRLQFFAYRTVYSIGPIGIAVAGVLLLLHRKSLLQEVKSREALFLASVVGVIVVLALFVYAPLDRSYLLPAFPFLFIVLDALVSSRQMVVVLLAVASFAFLNPDVTRHDAAAANPAFNPRAGIVIEEYQKRMLNLEERRMAPALALGAPAVVITGIGEQFWFENAHVEKDTGAFWKSFGDTVMHAVRNPDLHFISLMSRDEIKRARSAGYTPYCLAQRRRYVESVIGSSTLDAGITVIPLFDTFKDLVPR